MKKLLNHIFIDGLSGMALGLFSTLIVGTIIQQIGNLIGGNIGDMLFIMGKMAAAMTGAGIGVGVAHRYQESPLVVLSAATAGMTGGFASKILAGSLLVDGSVVLAGPGEPLGAFVAAFAGIELGHLVSGKTKVDILVTPIVTIVTGCAVGLIVGPPISKFMTGLGAIINWGTEQQPFIMGIVVSVLMGMILTLPISSAALGIILNLSGLAAGAATIGCCCNMVGFAVASYRENKVAGLLAQGRWNIYAAGAEYCKKTNHMDSGDCFQCRFGTGQHNAGQNDEQCNRLRYGNRRICRADHDLSDDGTGNRRYHDNDHHCGIPDCAAGSDHTGSVRIYEKKKAGSKTAI